MGSDMNYFRKFLIAYRDFYHDKDVRKFMPDDFFKQLPTPEEAAEEDMWELSDLAEKLSEVLDVAQGIVKLTEDALDLLDEVSEDELD